jgi:hypothetical protein
MTLVPVAVYEYETSSDIEGKTNVVQPKISRNLNAAA